MSFWWHNCLILQIAYDRNRISFGHIHNMTMYNSQLYKLHTAQCTRCSWIQTIKRCDSLKQNLSTKFCWIFEQQVNAKKQKLCYLHCLATDTVRERGREIFESEWWTLLIKYEKYWMVTMNVSWCRKKSSGSSCKL